SVLRSPEKALNATLSIGPDPTWGATVQNSPDATRPERRADDPARPQPAAGNKAAGSSRRSVIPRFSPLQWGAFASFPVIVGIALLASNYHRRPIDPPIARNGLVQVETGLSAAEITIDGKPVTAFPVLLSVGRHVAEAKTPGYQS